jgi:hypothetical protein
MLDSHAHVNSRMKQKIKKVKHARNGVPKKGTPLLTRGRDLDQAL